MSATSTCRWATIRSTTPAFYHARRILDAVREGAPVRQFDDHIHAPEGSLLVWPWGYDSLMTALVRAGLWVGLSSDPMTILTWIPVAAAAVSIGLLVTVARQLQLSPWPAAIAAACMALAPTTQLLHGPGQVDHHFAELICVLAALAAGLRWLQTPASSRAAAQLGGVLGIAPAIHNALFILQLPILIVLCAWWLQGLRVDRKAARAFAVTLVLVTLAVLLPSLPFRLGHFEFYTLSWFHLYVGASSAIMMILLSHVSATRKSLLVLALVAAALSIPLFGQLHVAGTFMGGLNRHLGSINEMQSPLRAVLRQGYMPMARIYSFLLLLAPLAFIVCLLQCWRERTSFRSLFWITSVLGLALLSLQQRLHYFGGFALYLPWLVLAADIVRARPALQRRIFLGATVTAVVMYSPVLRYQLLEPMPPANDPYFAGVRPLYEILGQECAREPGIVLADSNAGHPIRFYTDCRVIANNFLLTPQHFAKLDQADHLFSLSAAELSRQQPQIRYLLIRALAMRELADGSVQYQLFFSRTARLANELLFSDPSSVPPGYTLLKEVSFGGRAPYARLFRLELETKESE